MSNEDDMVMGETLGEMEFGVSVEEISGYCERCRIGDKCIHGLVRWPINKMVDNKGEMLRVKKNYRESPVEMLIWDVIEDTSPLNQWDGDLYNEKDPDLNNFNVSRPYKMVK